MWRDPLDELIADLDRVVTPDPQAQLPSMVDVITITDTILYGSAAAKARLPRDPAYQRVVAHWEAMRGGQPDAASAEEGSPPTPSHASAAAMDSED
jgi:hypothetical protein